LRPQGYNANGASSNATEQAQVASDGPQIEYLLMNMDIIHNECQLTGYYSDEEQNDDGNDDDSNTSSEFSGPPLLPRRFAQGIELDDENTMQDELPVDADSRDSEWSNSSQYLDDEYDWPSGPPYEWQDDEISKDFQPISSGVAELVLGAMQFPTTQKWLDDPNVWVGDTGATVHMTPHRTGMTNVQQASGKDAVTMGNGQSETAAKIGDIPGTICDKTGTTMATAKIKDALYLPSAMYNLFSITKLQRKGWTLH
jgi:hypothetical protein